MTNQAPRILLVDDDPDCLMILEDKLNRVGYDRIRSEYDPRRAAERIANGTGFDIALIDMTMPVMDGLRLLEHIQIHSPQTECIMVTAVNDARTAVACMRKGAYDYLVKPVSQEDLSMSLNRALERKRLLDLLDIRHGPQTPQLKNKTAFEAIITRSRDVASILRAAELHAGSNVPVLITGESGTGKELLARAIHAASPRAHHPFTAVNMASVSDSLFEAEFFGHTNGAFTGATRERAGYLKNTDRGTLFLDEIGNLPLTLQGKLLRVLQDGEVTRLGTSRPQRIDFRIIAATNENLERLMAQNLFRKDLYYRIRGGLLHMPPLRQRSEDIPLLATAFVEAAAGSQKAKIEEDAMCLLMAYSYPGNVRELKAVMDSAVNLAQGGPIRVRHLPENLQTAVDQCPPPAESDSGIQPLAEVEKNHIIKAYRQCRNNKSQTARKLAIGLNTLRRKLKRYDLA